MKERLKVFLAENDLSAKQFSEIIGVQASSISHILTGRNKPSVELLQKILRSFPEFDIYWLLTGKRGIQAPKSIEGAEKHEPNTDDELLSVNVEAHSKEVVSVLCLYKDGSFEKFDLRS